MKAVARLWLEDPMSTESMMKREIRLGVVMTGGVSLAVWMGGVSLELYRAVAVDREGGSSSVYEGLKALTSTDISVDVISGTSAGGLNGVLLAAAVAYRRPEADVRSLRDIWLNVGNLRDLIRPPNDTDPRSVLRGDGAFLPPVLKVLRDFIDEGEPAQADVTLGLTTTLIHPEVVRHTDDLGDDMAQPNHRGTFRFEFVKRQVPGFGAQHMARAARSSASFPGAFEASLVDEFPDENISFAIPRWVFDGGILNNQPLGIALDSMADRQASTEVRRVVAFVVPDPVMLDPLADRSDEAPTLGGVLAATVSIPMQQSIHDDLERLRRTNGRIEQQILSRRLIRLWDEDLESVAVQLQQLYLRVHSSYAAMYALRLMPDAWSPSIRQGVANAFASARSVLLSEALAERDEEAGQIETFEGVEWGYGIFGCRYVIETALGVIRRLLRSDRVKGPDGETSLGDQRQRLEEIFGELHQLRRIVRGVRDQDRNFWRSFFRDHDQHDDPRAAIGNQFEVWSDVDVEGEPVGVVLTTIAWRSVGLLVETRTLVVEEPDADEIVGDLAPADGDPGGDDLVGGEAEAGDGDLGDSDEMAVALGELIALTPVVAGQNPVDSAMRYMVSLFILNTVAGGASASEEREIGLVQISARAPSLDPHHPSPADKLSGVQLGHFGAFFKRSWRANDWMWGRSDGADRIVRILLEPGRLRRCYLVPESASMRWEPSMGSCRRTSSARSWNYLRSVPWR
jgi:patatin-related protein